MTMTMADPAVPPLELCKVFTQHLGQLDPYLDLDATRIEHCSELGPMRWCMTLDDEVVTCSILALTPSGWRTVGVQVWPLDHTPRPWGEWVRTAVAEHRLRWDHLTTAIESAMPTEAAGWWPAPVSE